MFKTFKRITKWINMDYNSVVVAARKYLETTGNQFPTVESVKRDGDKWIALCTIGYGARVKKITFDDRSGEIIGYDDITPSR